MGIPVMILGESGSGKSYSLRNFAEHEVMIFNVANKMLPFKGKLDQIKNAGYKAIYAKLKQCKFKRYVIDDSQYLLTFEMFAKAKETGFQKFTDMALHFYNLIKKVLNETPDDVIIYFNHHIEKTDTGIKAKTIGKMLDEKLTLEGLFSIVLIAESENGRHYFRTKTDGNDTVKSPPGMFDALEIDNDLKLVDKCIRGYWELNK